MIAARSGRPDSAATPRTSRVDRGACLLLFALFLTLYISTSRSPLHEVDSWASFETAESLLHGHLASPPSPGLTQSHGGQTFSKYGIGAALIMVPFVAIGHGIAALTGWNPATCAEAMESLHEAPFAAAACVLFFVLALRLGSPRARALDCAVVAGLASLCWPYGVRDYSEAAQMCFVLGAVLGVLDMSPGAASRGGCSLGFAILVKAVTMVYVPVFLSYVIWAGGRLSTVVRFLAPISVAIAGLVCLNYARFGSILEFGYGAEGQMFSTQALPANMLRLLLSPAFGLFIYSPVCLIAALTFPRFFRDHRKKAFLLCALILTNLVVNAAWHDIAGGRSWGPRLLAPTALLWLVPLPVVFSGLNRLRQRAVYLLTAGSVGVALLGVFETVRPFMAAGRPLVGPAPLVLANKLLNKLGTMRVDRYPLDFWYVKIASDAGRPQLAWLALLGLPLVVALGIRLYRERQTWVIDHADMVAG